MTGRTPSREALEAGVRALRRRDHAAGSLKARLARKGFDPDACADAVARLEELGYLDDERFARERASALAGRGVGDLLIADDLEQQGVSRELVTVVLDGLAPELERAQGIVAARGATLQTARLLARRGFGHEVIERVVAAVTGEPLG